MRQMSLFSRAEIASVRDRTRARNYSPERDEFRRQHERHRVWGLRRRHAGKLARIRGREAGSAGRAADGGCATSEAPGVARSVSRAGSSTPGDAPPVPGAAPSAPRAVAEEASAALSAPGAAAVEVGAPPSVPRAAEAEFSTAPTTPATPHCGVPPKVRATACEAFLLNFSGHCRMVVAVTLGQFMNGPLRRGRRAVVEVRSGHYLCGACAKNGAGRIREPEALRCRAGPGGMPAFGWSVVAGPSPRGGWSLVESLWREARGADPRSPDARE